MAHIPLIHGADGAKLSKRHGALGVDAYRAMGYCPRRCAIIWCGSDGAKATRNFFDPEMIEAFDLAHVGRAPARFDLAKLESMNGRYIQQAGMRNSLPRWNPLCPICLEAPALGKSSTIRCERNCARPCRV